MRRLFRVATFVVAGLFAGVPESTAQQLSISGVVDDTYGVLPGASVTLRAPNGATQKTTTSAEGKYDFGGLAAGSYEIAVAREGFDTVTRTLTLTAEARTLNVTLAVAGISASVDVVDVSGKTTGSRMEVPEREIPNQVSVVSQATLREQGVNDLASALENVSGVITQVQYGVYEWYTIGGITQQSGNDFLYVDGMTLTGNRANTQLLNVEQIEVFKGPNAVLYGGAGASQGGMVNIIRKKPQATPSTELLYRVGRWGSQQVAAGMSGQLFGLSRLLFRLDTGFADTDGWRQGGSQRFNTTPAVTWLLTDQMRVTFNESVTRDRYDLDAGVPSNLLSRADFPLDRRLNPPGDFQLTRDWQNQIVYNANFTSRLQFRNSFFNRIKRDQYLDAESLSYNAATDVLSRSVLYYQHNRRPTQNQSDLLGDFDLVGMRHRFMVGYNYERHYNYSNRVGNGPGTNNSAAALPIPSVVIADFLAEGFVDSAPIYRSFPRTRVDYSNNQVNAGYWQDQIDLTSRLRINVAGRYDNYRRRTHNDTYDNDVFVSKGPETGRHQTNYSYRVGAVYALTDNHWVYGSSSSTFQPVFTIPADGAEFEPTRSRSYEFGHKFQALNGRLVATTGLRRVLNYNILIPLGGNLFEQAGKSHSDVVDFDLEGTLGRGFRAAASYGFAEPVFDDFKQSATGANLRGNRLPHAPKHTARFWGTKSFPVSQRSSVAVSLGGRFVEKYFTNSTNTFTLPDRVTFDGAVSFRTTAWEVGVNLVNLTNKERYFVSQINGSQFYPGQPFSATLTLRYRFQTARDRFQ